MAYIYCITNKINGKQYVGKTENTIDKRWKEHCNDYLKERCEKRPLYNAMKKYGIDNFEIKELEYLKEGGKLLSDRETYWIEQLDTYNSGYNATKGGDGNTIFNYDNIIALYKQGKSMEEVSKIVNCSRDTVSNIINSHNIPKNKILSGSCKQPKSILQYNKDTEEFIQEFKTMTIAAHWLADNGYAKIYSTGIVQKLGDCCKGKIKSAYKFKWKYK